MSGAAGRRREAVPRAGGVGGEVGFFLYIKNFLPTKKFIQNFFSFDFDAIFFILSIFFFFGCKIFLPKFFYSECKKNSKFLNFCLSN